MSRVFWLVLVLAGCQSCPVPREPVPCVTDSQCEERNPQLIDPRHHW